MESRYVTLRGRASSDEKSKSGGLTIFGTNRPVSCLAETLGNG